MDNRVFTLRDMIDIWTKYPCEYKENRCDGSSLCICKLGQPWCNIHTCPLVFNFETNKFERQNLDAESDCYKSIVFMELLFKEHGEHHLLSFKYFNLSSDEQIRLKHIGFFDIVEPIKMRFYDQGGEVLVKDMIVLDGPSRKCYFDTLLSAGHEKYDVLNKHIKDCLNNKDFRFLVFEKQHF